MKYMALIYGDPEREPQQGTPEFDTYMAGFFQANEAYAKAGILIGGEALDHSSTATTIRRKGGKLETMDGPFAESKEQLGGYYILECANLDEALRYAAMIPTVDCGSVEVRPITEINPETLKDKMA